ncbi:bifunctional tetrahydrofolate synthase/dihydrofolate synthase [Pseudoalteromonas lipolytica]|jgi:dihydrofolate synthase/folylpolyglutamate synthase|uniref:Dihydrofolate synthase/folylpolyglutamate synthase n=1 Tax=Pseudoalteromonas lipolytica TaxID=570156 RepID=A0AAD0RZ76_9GAMM|nr:MULTISPECIES: bifunctional tetrahydrofolate synthase/dihydrofolate synthase [Pseudoalteromonas]AXV64753.1 bifunctional tetrahydrofolate synthase/dihydrofolate synthase [Pseudoalteromonas donghaensis]MCC9661432.1 bifunctional tetrahydrofolate synthase/dihydrofolate synthase [Pseudoalteromonas sp. MB41]QLJ09239.1 bifunctional tetrahydrofolate synthase/dihydrofolate synthase [Pseudoalteromonas sp. JSTW]QMW15468.1 bifunctional tetrahydrofolate synthase/dihydrofolate synthase [Pseudoalteromonas s
MTEILPSQSSSLDDWLCYLESIHPANIEMGLERVARVANQVDLLNSPSKIILIAGTNGKGTTARCLESLLLAQGFSVGTYASPHLIRYNERVRINGQELDDQFHVDAFDMLEKGRGDTSLTYFEYGTLGALAIFKRHAVDYVLLEVGLGGRYDATNIVTPHACVITTIDLDHKEYLGDTRELVGYDKAGIFRNNTPAVVGDLNIPHTVTDYGNEINADMVLSGRDFTFAEDADGFNWQYQGNNWRFAKPAIPCQNAATALTLLSKLALLPREQQVRECLANLTVEGRFQQLSDTPRVFTDVAHNPESARYLARKLSVYKDQGFKIHALVAMLADKDKVAAMSAVADVVDEWSLASLDCFRGDTVENLAKALAETPSTAPSTHYPNVEAALDKIVQTVDANTLVIVFGSFITVAAAINYFKK